MTAGAVPAVALGLLVALAGCAGGKQAATASEGEAPLAPGALAGVVLDPAIRPLAGVTVSIPGRPDVAANVTGTDGTFLLTGVGAGTVVVSAGKAGYLTAFVQAEAGDPEAAPLQVLLQPLQETQPYTVLESYDGFMECGVGSAPAMGIMAGCMVIVGGTLYIACVGSDPVPPTGVCVGETSPYYVSTARGNMTTAQTEAVWSPTVQGQSELLIGSYVVDTQGAVVGGLPYAVGQSILVRPLNATVVDEADLGGANSAAIFVNPGNSGPANLVVQQAYQVFHTSTFHFELEEGWIFAVDGPPEVPEQCTVCDLNG